MVQSLLSSVFSSNNDSSNVDIDIITAPTTNSHNDNKIMKNPENSIDLVTTTIKIVEFSKRNFPSPSMLQQSTTKSLLSEMLKKQVEQQNENDLNQISLIKRKPIMISPNKRNNNIISRKVNINGDDDFDHEHVSEGINPNMNNHENKNLCATTKSLKFGNCPLVVRERVKPTVQREDDNSDEINNENAVDANNACSNVTKVTIDPHPVNWVSSMMHHVKKGIPIPQPTINNLNLDYNLGHNKYRSVHYKHGEEGLFWPMSI
ncbi:8348_t:CDS:2 [Diversispora eburnea]|uniref:8348_t:CDS:1 n=1 Tax=Diversispora eburnea TaxID=1213867 RepID=A0A9N8VX42_9GLOM|nr:8348_t:CDS:2 [Diversispora eburnea]